MSDLNADSTTEAKADCARIGGTLLFSFVFLSGCVFDPSGIGESGLNNIQYNNNNYNNDNNTNNNNDNVNVNVNNNNNGNNGPVEECGNGVLEDGEECDDGNTENGDGCSSECTIEENFACWGEPSVCVCRVHVNINNISSTSDGASFDTGFLTLREGINRAADLGECEVWVTRGIYHVYEHDGDDTITLAEDVAVYGGFAGSESARPERNWLANETVLSGRQEGNQANRVRNVVTASSAGNTILDGFIIKGGNADMFSANGGGLLCKNSNITIANCIFQENNATQDGGGVYMENCHSLVLQTSFSGNSALWDGGGVATDGGSVIFDECEFRQNNATWYGGGMFISASTVSEIRNSDFHENNADQGGGIYTNGGAPEILGCGFYKNTATAPYGGAGFHANFGDIVIRQSTFEENSSPRGAGVYFNDANGSVEASWFEGNTTTNYGGALYFRYCNSVELINLVAWSNTSNEGGAVLNFWCDLRVVNSTLYGNTAHSTGGAFYSYGANAVTTIINSILWNNSPNEIADVASSSTPVHYSNVSQTGYAGTNHNINADPKFANPATGDFRLQSDSPCIGSANGTQAPAFDIEGNPRSSDTPDMGAYEYSN